MDVLKSLRGSFKHAQQDISASWSNFRSSDKSPRSKQSQGFVDVNLDAGADLLHRHQEYWEEIHKNNEANASRAQEIDKQAVSIFNRMEKANNSITQLYTELNDLPGVAGTLQDVTSKIAILGSLLEDTEKLLMKLEDSIENQELEKEKANHRYQFVKYKESKNAELDKVKVKLSNEHAQRIKEYDQSQRSEQLERQKTFESAFNEDMERYKQQGGIERHPSVEIDTGEVALASITLEENIDDLETFLGSDDAEFSEQVLSVNTDTFDIQDTEKHEPDISETTDDTNNTSENKPDPDNKENDS